VHHFSDFALKISPDLLLVLDDVLSFIELVFQIINLLFEILDLVIFLLLEISEHLLEDEDLRLVVLPRFQQLIDLLLHSFLSFLIRSEPCLHLKIVVALLGRTVLMLDGICTLLRSILLQIISGVFGHSQQLLVQLQVHIQVPDLFFELIVLFPVVIDLGGLLERDKLLVLRVVSEEPVVHASKNGFSFHIFELVPSCSFSEAAIFVGSSFLSSAGGG